MSQLPKLPGSLPPNANKPVPSAPPPPPRPPASNPFGNRLGGRADFPILSTGEIVARFELTSVPASLWNPVLDERLSAEDAITLFESNKALVERAKAELDAAWTRYNFRGAALMYAWRDELRHALNNRLMTLKRPTVYLYITDPVLVLNILGRSRASLLLTDAPLALERVFLNRILATDDPRLIQFARDAGSREELIFEPPPVEEIDDSDNDNK